MTFFATILTLYPEMFPGPLRLSLAGRALEQGRWTLDTTQIRNYAADGHYSRPDVFELRVDTRAKDGVNWGAVK